MAESVRRDLLAQLAVEVERLEEHNAKLTDEVLRLQRQLEQHFAMDDTASTADEKEVIVHRSQAPLSIVPAVGREAKHEAEPPGDASGVQVWPVWAGLSPRRTPGMSAGSTTSLLAPALLMAQQKYEEQLEEKTILQRLISHPDAAHQVVWDMLCILCMFYDVVMFPMQTFNLDSIRGTLDLFDLIVVVFWTLDIPNTFTKGFYTNGVLEMRPSKIATSYVRGHLLFDLSIVCLDWILFSSIGFFRLLKWPRLVRSLRLLRATRMMKICSAIARARDRIGLYFAETAKIIVGIINALLFMLVACHYVACGWYAIGTWDAVREGSGSWVHTHLESGAGRDSVPALYLTSLHWSLTQFTPASMEVVPENPGESLYTICILLLGMLVFSSFISTITSSMSRVRMLNIDRHRNLALLRRYILEHHLSMSLGTRLYSFAKRQEATFVRRQMHEEDVSVLRNLPDKLRMELLEEIFLPTLVIHPLFWYQCQHCTDESIATLLRTAMTERMHTEAELLFAVGQEATHTYFTMSARCRYRAFERVENVPEDAVVAEAVLWVPWVHKGIFFSDTSYECIALDAHAYRSIARQSTHHDQLCAYARDYAALLTESSSTESDLCTDIDKARELAQRAFDREDLSEAPTPAELGRARVHRGTFSQLLYWFNSPGGTS